MDNKELVLGLDIGIASVGWGIVDKKSGLIIDKGVRLFSEATAESNEKRRSMRHIRRSIRRKEFRLYRTKKLLIDMGLISSLEFLPFSNPYQIRCKGLTQKLTKDELATALLHLIKRNGFRYDVADDEDSGTKTIKEDFLCQHLLNKFNEEGKIRGITNKFHFSLYKKEFLKLLEVQEIKDEYKEKLLDIFEKRRNFEDGPGGPNSPTKYGRYLELNAEPINLIDKMRGRCSVFKDKPRAPKVCPSAEIYNILNDLNNLSVLGNKIGAETKTIILENYILDKGKITIKQLENVLGCSQNNITGCRVNAKGQILISEAQSIQKIRAICKKEQLGEFYINTTYDLETLDEVFEILTKTKSIEGRINELKTKLGNKLSLDYIKAFALIKGVANYHSLSLDALRILSKEMFETHKNAQQIIVTLEKNVNNGSELKLPDDIIMSPVAKRAVNQTFKIIKAVIKQYGTLNTVLIEMTREKNSKEAKKQYEDFLKKQALKNDQINKLLEGKIDTSTNTHLNDSNLKNLREKLSYYIEQDAKSVYSQKPIDLNVLINNPSLFEIDHIIPYSISFDDSRNNKVLVYAIENQEKGQRSPYQAISSGCKSFSSYLDLETYAKTNSNFSMKKRENLLTKININSNDAREEFINRNLSDTRYITKLVLNILKNYFHSNSIPTVVHVVNGALTHKLREICKLKKDRSLDCHHAVDALLAASMLKSKYLEDSFVKRIIDPETGEVFFEKSYEDIFGPVASAVAWQIKAFDPIKDYKFSYKIDSKANRSLSDETIYNTTYIDGELYLIKKYKNIYDKEGEKVKERIIKNDVDDFLISKYDKKTFLLLQKIVSTYINEKNPFAAYYKEHSYIRKVSKSKNSPIVCSLKYVEDRVNNYLDLSNCFKQNKPKKTKVVKVQLKPYRMDLYYSKEKGFKFLTVRQKDIQFKKDQFKIDPMFYDLLKKQRGIDESYNFINSYYRGDLIEIITESKNNFGVFKTVNNEKNNQIETSFFGCDTLKTLPNGQTKKFQNTITVPAKAKSIKKYTTDILGKKFEVKNERLKLSWK